MDDVLTSVHEIFPEEEPPARLRLLLEDIFTPSLAVTERWKARLGLEAGEIGKRMADVWHGGSIGAISEADVHLALAERFGFDEQRVEEFMGWIWREYLGSASTELIEYARQLRPRYRTGILSNRFVGAQQARPRDLRLDQ